MVFAAFVLIVVLGLLFSIPATFLLMLAIGNFGFTQFGFIDCIPAGILISSMAGAGARYSK